jgi:hypothetical protein
VLVALALTVTSEAGLFEPRRKLFWFHPSFRFPVRVFGLFRGSKTRRVGLAGLDSGSDCDLAAILNHPHNSIPDGGGFYGLQPAGLSGNEAVMRGKKFAGPHETVQPQGTARKIGRRQWNGFLVAVGFTRDLAENPIATTGFRQHDGRSRLGGAEIRKGEMNYDNFTDGK